MPPPPKRVCRSCGAPVLWVTLTSGKRMPLDPLPSPGGNVVLVEGDRARVVSGPELACTAPGRLFRAHFASCPFDCVHRRQSGYRPPRTPRRRPGQSPSEN